MYLVCSPTKEVVDAPEDTALDRKAELLSTRVALDSIVDRLGKNDV